MWAHYADDHHGICVGFRFVPHLFASDDLAGYTPYQVIYDDARPVVRAAGDAAEAGVTMVSVKSTDWAYEREWRIVHFNGYGVWRLRDQFMAEIVVGEQAPSDLVDEVAHLVSGYTRFRPAILRARCSEDAFVVEADVIDPGIPWQP